MTRIIAFIALNLENIHIVNKTLKPRVSDRERKLETSYEVCFTDNYSVTNMYSEECDN